MKKIIVSLLLAFMAVPAFADLTVKMTAPSNSSYVAEIISGEVSGTVVGLNNNKFDTFCVEHNESFSKGSTYAATIGDKILPGGDELKDITKKLYSAWLTDKLVVTAQFNAATVQNVIWKTQGYNVNVSTTTMNNIDTFLANNASLTANAQYVKVLNLTNVGNSQATRQSQMIMIIPDTPTHTVPAPGAVLLSGLGTTLVGLVRRRSL